MSKLNGSACPGARTESGKHSGLAVLGTCVFRQPLWLSHGSTCSHYHSSDMGSESGERTTAFCRGHSEWGALRQEVCLRGSERGPGGSVPREGAECGERLLERQ